MADKSLAGKLVSQIEIKSDGDVFHEIFRERPHHVSGMSPDKVQNVGLHDGDWGKVGSVIFWNYTHGMYRVYIYTYIYLCVCVSLCFLVLS